MSQSLPVPLRRFPGLHNKLLAGRRIYLDNACLTPVVSEAVGAIQEFYQQPPGCPLRSKTGRSSTLEERIRDARDGVRSFLNAKFTDEIIFTPNTTFGINLIASAFLKIPGKVLISDLEHNSNRLPWLHHQRHELAWPPGRPFPMDEYVKVLDGNFKLVALTAMSNVTGMAIPVREVVAAAHRKDIPVLLDAAQAFGCGQIDITEDRPDYLAVSLHKAYGPTGVGALYVRRDLQPGLQPLFMGAGTVDDHFNESLGWTSGAPRFEFGLQNYAGIYAIPPVMSFLKSIDSTQLKGHYERLQTALRDVLRRISGVHLLDSGSPGAHNNVCSFYVEGKDSGLLSSLLDMAGNIQVRAGRLCAHHWFNRYSVPDVVRISFGVHNSVEDVEDYGRTFSKILGHYT
jgi:cysteine desulfurase/selenocysteine lyase